MSEITDSINDFLSIQGLDLTKHVFNHNTLSNFLIECRDEIEKLEAALRMVIDWDNTLDWEEALAWDDVMKVAHKALEGKDE